MPTPRSGPGSWRRRRSPRGRPLVGELPRDLVEPGAPDEGDHVHPLGRLPLGLLGVRLAHGVGDAFDHEPAGGLLVLVLGRELVAGGAGALLVGELENEDPEERTGVVPEPAPGVATLVAGLLEDLPVLRGGVREVLDQPVEGDLAEGGRGQQVVAHRGVGHHQPTEVDRPGDAAGEGGRAQADRGGGDLVGRVGIRAAGEDEGDCSEDSGEPGGRRTSHPASIRHTAEVSPSHASSWAAAGSATAAAAAGRPSPHAWRSTSRRTSGFWAPGTP